MEAVVALTILSRALASMDQRNHVLESGDQIFAFVVIITLTILCK
jgi:hypothetical protein